ncbi:MAG: hypothetical protein IJ193_02600 [Bacilli bacterium]|nr:hypothetical protein [Bacilli bacterium]
MHTESLFIADPYNESHIKMFAEFEERNGVEKTTTEAWESLRAKFSEEQYKEFQKVQNEIMQTIFTMENDSVKDSCFIRGEQDIKTCELIFAPLKEEPRGRQLVGIASNYALNTLGMEQIYVSINPNDKNLRNSLISKGFEDIGTIEENSSSKLTFIKLKEDMKEASRVI